MPGTPTGTGAGGIHLYQPPSVPRSYLPRFILPLLTSFSSYCACTCDSASGLSSAVAAHSACEQHSVGIDSAGVVFSSQMGVGTKYALGGGDSEACSPSFPRGPRWEYDSLAR